MHRNWQGVTDPQVNRLCTIERVPSFGPNVALYNAISLCIGVHTKGNHAYKNAGKAQVLHYVQQKQARKAMCCTHIKSTTRIT